MNNTTDKAGELTQTLPPVRSDMSFELYTALEAAVNALRSYQYGNASTELAKDIADHGQAVLTVAIGKPT